MTDLTFDAAAGVRGRVALPPDTTGVLVANGRETPLTPGDNEI